MEAAFGIVRQSVIRARPQGPLFAAAALAVCAALAPSAPVFAQLGPGGAQNLQRLLQSGPSLLRGGRARIGANDYLERPDVLIDPAEARRRAAGGLAVEEAPVSPLERDYSLRSGEFLRQFGYATFRNRVLYRNRTTGAIRDSYRLGVGDEVIVTLHGQDWSNLSVPVDRSGRIIVPQLPPVAAAGRTLGEVRASLRASVKRSMLGTEVFVSMGRLRAVDVTVAGEVEFPGVYHLTGLSSLMDALIHAGGPNRKGSLRRIHLNRGEEVRTIDLYELFVRGGLRRDITLREGDRIVVPTIGPTVALAGHVKRPAVYELPAGRPPLLRRVLDYAGGPIRPRGNRFTRISVDDDGRERVEEHRALGALRARDGDVLVVRPGGNIQIGGVRLEGEVRVPGRRSLAAASSVRGLIPDIDALGRDAYLHFAVIRRLDRRSLAPTYLPVSLLKVLAGEADHALQSEDAVIVFHRRDVEFLGAADVQAVLARRPPPSVVLAPTKAETEAREARRKEAEAQAAAARLDGGAAAGAPGAGALSAQGAAPARAGPPDGRGPAGPFDEEEEKPGLVRKGPGPALARTDYDCAGLRTLSALVEDGGAGRFANARRTAAAHGSSTVVNVVACPEIFDRYPDLLPFVLDRVAAVDGEVLAPGIYPIVGAVPIREVAEVAGGAAREADLSKIEVTLVRRSESGGEASFRRSVEELGGGPGAAVRPGDSVRFRNVFTARRLGPMRLSGEFRYPGTYRIRRGERLSEIIERAGGLTGQAYPLGAVFLRRSAREAEREALKRVARQLQIAIAAEGGKAVAAGSALVRQLLETEPLGRVVVEADPTVLAARPEVDVSVEPGDHLVMPSRPNTVYVSGAVLNPGSLQFSPRLQARDYIETAGGLDLAADEGRIFAIFPDGRAKRLRVSSWNYEPVNLPPGSTIVVPRDPAPFDLREFLIEATDHLSKLAVTAASIAAIND